MPDLIWRSSSAREYVLIVLAFWVTSEVWGCPWRLRTDKRAQCARRATGGTLINMWVDSKIKVYNTDGEFRLTTEVRDDQNRLIVKVTKFFLGLIGATNSRFLSQYS